MAANAKLFNRYVWLMELIYSAGRITREEIDRHWASSYLNDEHTKSIPARTFHRWKNDIEELFHVTISCEKAKNAYYIDNSAEIADSTTLQWLLQTFAVTNIINENETMQEHILLESMPSDARYLAPLVEAMRLGRMLEVTYKKFGDTQPESFTMEPYCVKAFKQRWYMVGISSRHPNEIRVYALDRIQSMHSTDVSYTIPKDFDGKRYFQNYFGVYTGPEQVEKVVLEVKAKSADYLRSLPLHHSQKEIERYADYSVFEYYIAPTFDFRQELLTHGSDLVVKEPLWLAEKFISGHLV